MFWGRIPGVAIKLFSREKNKPIRLVSEIARVCMYHVRTSDINARARIGRVRGVFHDNITREMRTAADACN